LLPNTHAFVTKHLLFNYFLPYPTSVFAAKGAIRTTQPSPEASVLVLQQLSSVAASSGGGGGGGGGDPDDDPDGVNVDVDVYDVVSTDAHRRRIASLLDRVTATAGGDVGGGGGVVGGDDAACISDFVQLCVDVRAAVATNREVAASDEIDGATDDGGDASIATPTASRKSGGSGGGGDGSGGDGKLARGRGAKRAVSHQDVGDDKCDVADELGDFDLRLDGGKSGNKRFDAVLDEAAEPESDSESDEDR
jgi:hypothetical protein